MKLSETAFLLVALVAVFLLSHLLRNNFTHARDAYVRVAHHGWRRQTEAVETEELPGPLHLGQCHVTPNPDTVAEVQQLRHLTLYRSRDVYNNTNYMRFECVPKLSNYNYGAQGLGEVLTDTIVKLLQLPVIVPCIKAFTLPARVFSRTTTNSPDVFLPDGLKEYPVHEQCLLPRHGERVVFGTMSGDVGADLVLAESREVLHPMIKPQWLSLFRAPRLSTGVQGAEAQANTTWSYEDKMKLADISTIMLLDFIIANNDRGFSKNWFFSPSLQRFIALDNGYLFGERSVCSPAFSSGWALACPPLLARLAENQRVALDDGEEEEGAQRTPCGNKIRNCVFSRTAVQRLELHHQRLAIHLRETLGRRAWLRDFDELTRNRKLPRQAAVLLRRSFEGCSSVGRFASFEKAIDFITDGTVGRVRRALEHIAQCREEFGDEYVLQLP